MYYLHTFFVFPIEVVIISLTGCDSTGLLSLTGCDSTDLSVVTSLFLLELGVIGAALLVRTGCDLPLLSDSG